MMPNALRVLEPLGHPAPGMAPPFFPGVGAGVVEAGDADFDGAACDISVRPYGGGVSFEFTMSAASDRQAHEVVTSGG